MKSITYSGNCVTYAYGPPTLFSVNETRHGITLPCYHGNFDTPSCHKLWGLTQSPHSPQLALSTTIVLSLGSPHTAVQGAMPISSVSGTD